MVEVPCYKCKYRIEGCHSSCRLYKEYKKKLEYINNKRQEIKKSEYVNKYYNNRRFL